MEHGEDTASTSIKLTGRDLLSLQALAVVQGTSVGALIRLGIGAICKDWRSDDALTGRRHCWKLTVVPAMQDDPEAIKPSRKRFCGNRKGFWSNAGEPSGMK